MFIDFDVKLELHGQNTIITNSIIESTNLNEKNLTYQLSPKQPLESNRSQLSHTVRNSHFSFDARRRSVKIRRRAKPTEKLTEAKFT